MVPFAGYSMPVHYPQGIVKEHLHTREKASIFDVSHMGQYTISGKGVAAALEKVLPIALIDLAPGRQRYGFLTNQQGGIIDDLMLTRITEDSFYLVVNAARKAFDHEHLATQLKDFDIKTIEDHTLIAVQGPLATAILKTHMADVSTLKFMESHLFNVGGVKCRVWRSGYTGEDGYEIAIPNHGALALTEKLLSHDAIQLAGLGARDSLRLEAGLCLYGNDIDEGTTPVEANLTWAISPVRKPGGERQGGFIGEKNIFKQLQYGADSKRVGLHIDDKIPVRAGSELFDQSNHLVGRVTSGGYGASVGAPIAMGYVERHLAMPGTTLSAKVRQKHVVLKVTKLPFIRHRYARG